MIQNSRGADSKSLLREAESGHLLISDESLKSYFEFKLKDVIENRRDPERIKTGETQLKREILAYLQQQGEVKTANVWCRKIKFLEVESLLNEINEALSKEDIQGVLELHLQDREINSPHIQFVGINIERAEEIIANIVVARNYEDSFETAVSRGLYPAYLDKENIPRVLSFDDERNTRIEIEQGEIKERERRSEYKEYLDNLDKKREEFYKTLGIKKEEVNKAVSRILDLTKNVSEKYENRRQELLNRDLDDMVKSWKKRRNFK